MNPSWLSSTLLFGTFFLCFQPTQAQWAVGGGMSLGSSNLKPGAQVRGEYQRFHPFALAVYGSVFLREETIALGSRSTSRLFTVDADLHYLLKLGDHKTYPLLGFNTSILRFNFEDQGRTVLSESTLDYSLNMGFGGKILIYRSIYSYLEVKYIFGAPSQFVGTLGVMVRIGK